jgi:hypothetical protein
MPKKEISLRELMKGILAEYTLINIEYGIVKEGDSIIELMTKKKYRKRKQVIQWN